MFKSRFWALLPLLTFLVIYLFTGLWWNDFYRMPVIVAFLISAFVGFIMYPKISFHDKTEEFARGAGDSGIMLMVLIFILAGAFAGLTKHIGAVNATVQWALSYLSAQYLMGGLFLTACFISLSLGTSVGTIVALTPIAAGIGEQVPGTLAVSLGAVVGGAMFGDNLSMISDTTIAATRTQGVEMRDKFRVNLWIALPPAVVTFFLYAFGSDYAVHAADHSSLPSLLLLLPYLFVLVAALAGMQVIWVLMAGVLLAMGVGLWQTDRDGWDLLKAVSEGMASMFELSILCMLIGGVVGLVRYYGGTEWIMQHLARWVNNARSGEFGIASLTAVVNAALANNTITILIVGPLAKDLAVKNQIDLRRSASILDTISCFVQGLLPYGAQMLAALAVSGYLVTPWAVMEFLYYPYLLGFSTLAFILRGQRTR